MYYDFKNYDCYELGVSSIPHQPDAWDIWEGEMKDVEGPTIHSIHHQHRPSAEGPHTRASTLSSGRAPIFTRPAKMAVNRLQSYEMGILRTIFPEKGEARYAGLLTKETRNVMSH